MKNYDVSELLKNIKPNLHKSYNGIFLTDEEVEVLKIYGFDINKYNNIKELMFDLEEYLNNESQEDLEKVLLSLAEFNYYNNTIK